MICFFSLLPRTAKRAKYGLLMYCALVIALVRPAFAEPLKFAVVVPKTTSRAQLIYDEIERGLRSPEDVELAVYRLGSAAQRKQSAVHAWLAKQNVDAIISIGRSAHELVKDFPTDVPLIAGGVSMSPNRASGVSLTGEPGEFFESLSRIAPKVDRVFLIYNEKINGWWVDEARAKASEYKIDLQALQTEDLKSGAKLYQRVLDNARPGQDAIWIPLVSIVPAKTVMPQVLKKAWEKNLVVFTNSAAHTRQGALFSMYPDNLALGQQLAQLATAQVTAGNASVKVVPVKKLKIAFNTRTASHLGLNYSSKRGSGFDRIYPIQ